MENSCNTRERKYVTSSSNNGKLEMHQDLYREAYSKSAMEGDNRASGKFMVPIVIGVASGVCAALQHHSTITT